MLATLASESPRHIALLYAWGKVCFSAWDTVLEHLASLTAWDAWPPAARMLLHALYPAYFIYASARRITGPEESQAGDRSKYVATLLIAAMAVALKGRRDGLAARKVVE
ncbi:MAG: hypothetical protein SGPRY_013590 [Prymnesium sp.]